MSELRAVHKGAGRWNVLNAQDEAVNQDWLDRDAAEKLAAEGLPKERPNRNKGRRERVTFGQMRSRLALDKTTQDRLDKLGKVPRWVNDEDDGGRLRTLYDKGYDFLKADGSEVIGDPDGGYQAPVEGTHLRKHVGTSRGGGPMYAYLMVTDKENYEEDAAAKEAVNSQVDDAIRGGNAPGSGKTSDSSSSGSTYVKDVQYKP